MKTSMLAASMMAALCSAAFAQTGTYTVRQLTPETALKAARGALEDCRKRGFQVAVAVVDRAGVAQAMLRDRFAGPHTVSTAINKGWTAVSFRTDTLELAQATAGASGSAGIRQLRHDGRRDRRIRCTGRRSRRRLRQGGHRRDPRRARVLKRSAAAPA